MDLIRHEFITDLRTHQDRLVQMVTEDLHTHGGPSYQHMPVGDLAGVIGKTLALWMDALETEDTTQVQAHAYRVGQMRVQSGVAIEEVLYVIRALRAMFWHVLETMRSDSNEYMRLIRAVETGLHDQLEALIRAYSEVTRAAQALLAEREQTLREQSMLIQELSTPIIPIFEGVLVLPLVGALDSHRATRVMEAALQAVAEYHTEVLLLDITGVPVVDTGVANYLIQLARAVSLLGAQVVLVGIGVEIAQTIVQLGVELRDIATRSNLQSGVEYALKRRGLTVHGQR